MVNQHRPSRLRQKLLNATVDGRRLLHAGIEAAVVFRRDLERLDQLAVLVHDLVDGGEVDHLRICLEDFDRRLLVVPVSH